MFDDDVKCVSLPAQVWELFSNAYSGDLLSEAGKNETVNVRAQEFEGFLYTVTSLCSGGLSGRSEANAWQLVPELMYMGTTFTCLDWDEQVRNGRRRGDYTGFKLKVKGSPMVCVKPVRFVATPPTVTPIALEVAERINTESSSMGWRSHHYKGIEPSWGFLSGHPVAVYEKGDSLVKLLFWRNGRRIEEFRVHGDQLLDKAAPAQVAVAAAPKVIPTQACLF